MQVIYRSKVLRIVLLFSFLIPLSACAATPATLASDPYQGTITVSGAFALYPMIQRWGEEFHNLHPGVQFDISAGGAGKGMTDVLSGAVDIGMISRDITSDEVTKGAYGIAVTKDAVFPTINMNNPLAGDIFTQGITRDTLTKIFIAGEVSY
jgi:phosphate transport system substrate-binding protein